MTRKSFHHLLAAFLLTIDLPGVVLAGNTPLASAKVPLTARVLDYGSRILQTRDPLSPVLVACLPGDAFPVRSELGDWCEVALPDGGTGWILARHTMVGPARSLPGAGGEIAGALAGTLVGSTVTAAFYGGTMVMLFGPLDLSPGIGGSGGVSRMTVQFALGATAACVILTPAAAAYGAYVAGERHRPGGNMLTSWAYAGAGGIVGLGLGYGFDALLAGATGETSGLFAGIGLLAGVTAGAVIGYEESKPPYARQWRWARHVRPPAVGLTTTGAAGDHRSLAVRMNVMDFRF